LPNPEEIDSFKVVELNLEENDLPVLEQEIE
jgi:hypothetical protein